ncbi:RNA polymerase sigma factor SigM [Micropruina sp.]|uniref:RNA polymerase sigma factor SigM n=1 Tax=Micropruina sp. TaxID=2737536 RepID=UPI0039E2D98B
MTAPARRRPLTDPDGPTDAQLLAAHVAGDDRAFTLLLERHADRLWSLALRVMRNPEDAADALQDAMISAFRRAGSFRGDAAVTTWLHRIVVNACFDRLRRIAARPAEPLPEDLDRSPALIAPDDPATDAVRASIADEVTEALAQIGADQRAALVLIDLEGYSMDEAARILGCAPGTVKSRCSRGRARLAVLLRHLKEVG